MLDRSERKVRVFRNGRSRAVRIPREFDFGGDEVIMQKQSDGSLVLRPASAKMTPRELIAWLRTQPSIDEDFPEIDDSDLLPLDDIEL